MRHHTSQDIASTFDRLRARFGASLRMNYFGLPESTTGLGLLEEDEGFAFLVEDRGCDRFYFMAGTLDFISRSAGSVTRTCPVVVDLVERAGREDVEMKRSLEEAGFKPHSIFRRFRCVRLPGLPANDRLAFARIDELAALDALLRDVFDPLNSHFPALNTLARYIEDETVLVIRGEEGELLGASVFHLQGKICNYDYLANRSGNIADTLSLLSNTYALLIWRGVISALLWADEKNEGVIRMHRRFGFAPDGTLDTILVKP